MNPSFREGVTGLRVLCVRNRLSILPILWRCAAVLVLAGILLAGCGCGGGKPELTPEQSAAAQAIALKKSSEWYDKKVYRLAEKEARKAGNTAEARYALFQSLVAQPEYETKLAEAELAAQSLVADAAANGRPVEAAREFLDKRNRLRQERRDKRKTPRAGLEATLAEKKSVEAKTLGQARVLSAVEHQEGPLGSLDLQLQFTNPYTKKSEKANLVLACEQVDGGWELDWSNSDLSPVSVLFGEPQHNFSEQGIEGLVSSGDSFAQWSASLQLVPADQSQSLSHLGQLESEWRQRHQGSKANRGPIVPKPAIFRGTNQDIVASKAWGLPRDLLIVMDRRYRLSSGLGVGNSVGDFLQTHDLMDPRQKWERGQGEYGTSDTGKRSAGGGIIMRDGSVMGLLAIEVRSPGSKWNLILYLVERDMRSPTPSLRQLKERPVRGMAYVPQRSDP